MSRFNTVTTVRRGDTVNLAGGEAFTVDPRYEFASIALTSFAGNQYYRKADETVERLKLLLGQIEPLFAAKVAIYARREAGMRSITHVIAGELAGEKSRGQAWARPFFRRIVRRPDDMLEIIAYITSTKGRRPLPNAVRWGFRSALESLDAYAIAKYQANGKAVSMLDLTNMLHPKPNETNADALKALIAGTLKQTDTWEARMSEIGQEEGDKDEVRSGAWGDMLARAKANDKGGIGYFALLRNLRNIIEQAPASIPLACELLADADRARRSLVMPFRAATAYHEIAQGQGNGRQPVVAALSSAVDALLANVPRFDGRTLVAVDCSGSMQNAGGKSPIRIASVFAAVLYKANDADLCLFGADAEWHSWDKATPTMSLAQMIEGHNGGGTDFKPIFGRAKSAYDRVVILSDMQSWIGGDSPVAAYEDYCQRVGGRPRIYSFDLAGYGTLQFPQPEVFCLAGFSDKTLDIMALLEEDRGALVRKIEAVTI